MKKLLPVALLVIAACTQEPVRVVLKGDQFFGNKQNYAAKNMVGSGHVAFSENTHPSRIEFHSEPSAEPSQIGQVGVSDLPPLTGSKQVVTIPEGRIMPGGSRIAMQTGSNALQHDLAEIKVASLSQEQAAQQNARFLPAAVRVESPSAGSGAEKNWYQGKIVLAKSEMTGPVEPLQSPQFIWPVRGKIISHFGKKTNGLHNDGINIAAIPGDPIYAAADGIVVYAGNDLKGYGNMVILRHEGGWMTAYAHAERLLVKENSRVRQGEKLATVGATGSVESAQLHFGLRNGKQPVDPVLYLRSDYALAR